MLAGYESGESVALLIEECEKASEYPRAPQRWRVRPAAPGVTCARDRSIHILHPT